MSHKAKKKRKARFFVGGPSPSPIRPEDIPDFDEFQLRTEARAARYEELRYRLAPDCKVTIQFNGVATQEALRKLIDYIELGINDFPRTADDPATSRLKSTKQEPNITA